VGWRTCFFGPVIDASATEHITAAGTLFGLVNKVGADGAVERVTGEVGESAFVVAVLGHFVEILYSIINILMLYIFLSTYKYLRAAELIVGNFR
jgi:hypothetical protein